MPQGRRNWLKSLAGVVAQVILNQRGALFPWVPVALAIGISGYFGFATEPQAGVVLGWAGMAVVMCGLGLRSGAVLGPPFWCAALILIGLCLGATRAQIVAAPVLGWRHYGPVEGRIIDIDRSASDAQRLTLDRVKLPGVNPAKTPHRVRISLHSDQPGSTLVPGLTVITTAHLSPPGGPVEPGGFDFRRHTWFDGLGAIGYTRVPVLALKPPDPYETIVFKARMALSVRILAVLKGDVGGFATAITTGDRSGLSKEVTHTLRRTNLAHLLAISGLHMGLVAGFVFGALRLLGASIPHVALNWPSRSIAALTAILAGATYLILSGGSIATERAFVMAAVAFLALVAGRRAISLRALAMAAIVVLTLRPEALVSPGFQMSFAATTALVAVFATLRGRAQGWPKWAKGALAVFVSSAVAGFATGPIGAAHFNTMSHYGLIANLISVPVMGVLIMPCAVVAVLLMPLGLEAIPLTVMGWGLNWILFVAGRVSDLPGAVGFVAAPGPWVLPLYGLGGLMLALWQGRGKWIGLLPLAAALILWSGAKRPTILIEESGMLVGVMGETGRALSREKSAGFTARVWLENDGSGKTQLDAARLWPGVQTLRHLTGKGNAAIASCTKSEILVLNHDPPKPLPCTVFSPRNLRQLGAVAIQITPQGPEITSAREKAGRRLWNDREIRETQLWSIGRDQ